MLDGYRIYETIEEDQERAVFRAFQTSSSSPVILKVAKGGHRSSVLMAKMVREYEVARRLPMDSIVRPLRLEQHNDWLVLVQEDTKGISLKHYLVQKGPLPLKEVLTMAIDLADSLEELHKYGVLHLDLKPGNMIIEPGSRRLRITDFGSALFMLSNEPIIGNEEYAEGSLPYMSPEQTGRLSRPVDARSDLYAFGAMLYEMLTGRLLFHEDEPAQWVHAHLTRKPVSPLILIPGLPAIVGELVLKLLEKEPALRYQTASGLKRDLEACLSQWEKDGCIEAFELGRSDWPKQLTLAAGRFGRDQELEQLSHKLEQLKFGGTEIVMITGAAGAGKTFLMQELKKEAVSRGVFYIEGKCEQLQSSIPYDPLVQAVKQWIGYMLTESREAVEVWKSKLSEEMLGLFSVIAAIVPELEVIIGPNPLPEPLPAVEASLRLKRAFRQLFQWMASSERPLVLFVDDLQWADVGSIELIESILSNPESGSLLVVGTYREQEMKPFGGILTGEAEWAKAGVGYTHIRLAPLSMSDFNEMVSQTLRRTTGETEPLTELLYRKTAGNPLFFRQWFESVQQEGWLWFNEQKRRWEWNLEDIEQKRMTEDLLQFLTRKLQRLPLETRDLLCAAACIGSRFSLQLAAEVSGVEPPAAARLLQPAVLEGILIPLDFTRTKRVGVNGSPADSDYLQEYRFLHDRIQQAAYLLQDEESRMRKHLAIGRAMGAAEGQEDRDGLLRRIGHLNRGLPLIQDQAELGQLKRWNIQAGFQAKEASSFTLALTFFQTAADLITESDWSENRSLCFELLLACSECEYLCGHDDRADRLYQQLRSRAQNRNERTRVAGLQITHLINRGSYAEAIRLGLRCMKEYGFHVPERPGRLRIATRLFRAKRCVLKHMGRIDQLPEMTDPDLLIIYDIMVRISVPAFFSNKEVFAMVIAECAELSIRYGNNPNASTAYAGFGILLSIALGDGETGYRLGETAVRLADRYGLSPMKSKTYVMFGGVLCQWYGDAQYGDSYMIEGLQHGLASGDHVFASYAMGAHINSLYVRETIHRLERLAAHYLDVLTEMQEPFVTQNLILYQRFFLALKGKTQAPGSFNGEGFDKQAFLKGIETEESKSTTLFQYYAYRTQVHFLLGRFEKAKEMAGKAAHYTEFATHLPHWVECLWYEALSITSLIDSPGRLPRTEELRLLRIIRRFRQWSQRMPLSIRHKLHAIEAELARIEGRQDEAIEKYDLAIQEANDHKHIQQEAVICELAARFHRGKGRLIIASGYAVMAYQGFLRWGASIAAERLLQEFPECGLGIPGSTVHAAEYPGKPNAPAEAQIAAARGVDPILAASSLRTSSLDSALDLEMILKTTETFSAQGDMEQWLSNLVKRIAVSAGADKAAILREENDGLKIDALYDQALDLLGEGSAPSLDDVCVPVVRYAIRAGQAVILVNAGKEGMFTQDPYIAAHSCRSVLCFPIELQGHAVGVVYFENRLLSGAFTEKRLSVLRMLASQWFYIQRLQTLLDLSQESPNRLKESSHEHESDAGRGEEQRGSEKMADKGQTDLLTERELEVLSLMAAGLSNQQIAERLVVSVGTVKVHSRNIFAKLQVKRRTQAVAQAKQLNLIADE